MRQVTVPQNEYVNIKIPKSYIDRKIEILLFPIDDINEESAAELSALKAYSNHSANLVEDWGHDSEDDVWK